MLSRFSDAIRAMCIIVGMYVIVYALCIHNMQVSDTPGCWWQRDSCAISKGDSCVLERWQRDNPRPFLPPPPPPPVATLQNTGLVARLLTLSTPSSDAARRAAGRRVAQGSFAELPLPSRAHYDATGGACRGVWRPWRSTERAHQPMKLPTAGGVTGRSSAGRASWSGCIGVADGWGRHPSGSLTARRWFNEVSWPLTVIPCPLIVNRYSLTVARYYFGSYIDGFCMDSGIFSIWVNGSKPLPTRRYRCGIVWRALLGEHVA